MERLSHALADGISIARRNMIKVIRVPELRPRALPTPRRIFAEWNPVSAVTQAARELFGNLPPGTPEPTVWPLQNCVL